MQNTSAQFAKATTKRRDRNLSPSQRANSPKLVVQPPLEPEKLKATKKRRNLNQSPSQAANSPKLVVKPPLEPKKTKEVFQALAEPCQILPTTQGVDESKFLYCTSCKQTREVDPEKPKLKSCKSCRGKKVTKYNREVAMSAEEVVVQYTTARESLLKSIREEAEQDSVGSDPELLGKCVDSFSSLLVEFNQQVMAATAILSVLKISDLKLNSDAAAKCCDITIKTVRAEVTTEGELAGKLEYYAFQAVQTIREIQAARKGAEEVNTAAAESNLHEYLPLRVGICNWCNDEDPGGKCPTCDGCILCCPTRFCTQELHSQDCESRKAAKKASQSLSGAAAEAGSKQPTDPDEKVCVDPELLESWKRKIDSLKQAQVLGLHGEGRVEYPTIAKKADGMTLIDMKGEIVQLLLQLNYQDWVELFNSVVHAEVRLANGELKNVKYSSLRPVGTPRSQLMVTDVTERPSVGKLVLFQTDIYGPQRIGGGIITAVSDADLEVHVHAASDSARSWMPSWSKTGRKPKSCKADPGSGFTAYLVLVALTDVEMYGTLLYPSHLVDEDTIEKMKSKNII